MIYAHGIGMLATIEEGAPRLRPLEFTQVEGEWWATTSRRMLQYLAQCDGQHVEILFVEDEAHDSRVHGVLECSVDPEDRRHLRELSEAQQIWLADANDVNVAIVKVIPESE